MYEESDSVTTVGGYKDVYSEIHWRGAITQIERIAAGYKWEKVQEAIRVVGVPTENDLVAVEDLGHALATGIDFGIF